MKRVLLSVMLVILLVTSPCLAARSVGYEELSCLSSAAAKITDGTIYDRNGNVVTYAALKAANADLWATVQVTAWPIAYRTDTVDPTASTKLTGSVGDIIWLESSFDVESFKAIGVGGTSILAIRFFSGAAR